MNMFHVLLATSPMLLSAKWILGSPGDSCSQACSAASLQCSSADLHRRNAEVNSGRELTFLLTSFNEVCTSYNSNYGSNKDVPAFEKQSGTCYVSDISRDASDYDCDRSTSPGKQRLCWCSSAPQTTQNCAQKKRAEGVKLSIGVIVLIVGCTIVASVCLASCCGFCWMRMKQRRQAKLEEEGLESECSQSRTLVHCRACQAQLERTQDMGAVSFSLVDARADSRPDNHEKTPASNKAAKQNQTKRFFQSLRSEEGDTPKGEGETNEAGSVENEV